MPIDKLYVRITCTMCSGNGHFSAGGYYNSLEPGKWGGCPYCDNEGTMYVEAAINVVVDYMIDIPSEKRDLILLKIAQKKSDSQ
jgi:hypothetical protein